MKRLGDALPYSVCSDLSCVVLFVIMGVSVLHFCYYTYAIQLAVLVISCHIMSCSINVSMFVSVFLLTSTSHQVQL